MPDRTGTLERLALELASLLQPLAARLRDDRILGTLAEVGLRFPDGILANAAFTNARDGIVGGAESLEASIEALLTVAGAADPDPLDVVARGVDLLNDVGSLIAGFAALQNQIQAVGPTMPGVSAGQVAALAGNFPRKLLDQFLISSMDTVPEVGQALTVVGLVDRTDHDGVDGDPTAPPWTEASVRFDRLGDLLTDPAGLLTSLYGWGDPGFDGVAMLTALRDAFGRLGLPALLVPASGPDPLKLEVFTADLSVDNSTSPPGLRIGFLAPFELGADTSIDLPAAGWKFTFRAAADVRAGVEGSLRPPLDFTISAGSAAVGVELEAGLEGKPAEPILLFGQSGGSRLEIGGVELGLGLALSAATASTATAAPSFAGAVDGGKLVIDSSNADGFIATLLSGINVESDFELALGWSAATGFRFEGSSALEIEIPVNKSLGPVHFPSIYLLAGFGSGGELTVGLAGSIKAELGALTAVVDRMGLNALVTFRNDASGNLGRAQIDFEFRPPTGIGLSVEGGPFSGGGFLEFDLENERYSGVLQLEFAGFLTLSAIGLITTRMPDGSKGFSLLIVISAELQPIQLGFGFTLNGVGGLLGLSRTIVTDALKQGIRDNAVDNIMFPDDPVGNATQLISDLRRIFPVKQDQFVFGPMAKLGWGTPTIITAELGIVIEVPDPVRIVIIGVVKAILPDEDAAILRIQVNFIGIIDFEAKYIYFEARLYDSRLLFITLSGGMAFLIGWGKDPAFMLTVGGFHPAYNPPNQQLPDIPRLMLSLLPGENPRLTLEVYFAVTSNTVQFGARLEFYAGVSAFNVYGWLGFDALFQFSPFMFVVSVGGGLAVRSGTSEIMGISVSLTLKGPTPWNAKGYGKFKILFVSFKVKFDKTWGEERNTALPDVDVLPLLLAALSDPSNWLAIPPSRGNTLVTVKELEVAVAGNVVVHPFGELAVSQKTLPLGVAVEKYGAAKIGDGDRFDIDSVTVGGESLATSTVKEEFAPAQYFDLSDSERLSTPSFERYGSGVRMGSAAGVAAGAPISREVVYEEIVIDETRRLSVGMLAMTVARFLHQLRGGSMAQSALSKKVKPAGSALSPDRVTLAQEGYAVVNVEDLRIADGATAEGLSYFEAKQQMSALAADSPGGESRLQVVPMYEIAA